MPPPITATVVDRGISCEVWTGVMLGATALIPGFDGRGRQSEMLISWTFAFAAPR